MVKIRTEGREYVFWWGRGYGQQTSMLLSPRLSHRSPKDLTGPQNLMLSIFFSHLGLFADPGPIGASWWMGCDQVDKGI